jgi:hypothetical protein
VEIARRLRTTVIAPSVLALGVLLPCCPGAFALNPSLDVSQYTHTAWRTREGFHNAMITSFAHMPDSFLWLGADLGLFRYDGVKAVPWRAQGQPLNWAPTTEPTPP